MVKRFEFWVFTTLISRLSAQTIAKKVDYINSFSQHVYRARMHRNLQTTQRSIIFS